MHCVNADCCVVLFPAYINSIFCIPIGETEAGVKMISSKNNAVPADIFILNLVQIPLNIFELLLSAGLCINTSFLP